MQLHARRFLRAHPQLRSVVTTYRRWGIQERDIVLASYPKSGRTWLGFMLAHLATGREVSDWDMHQRIIPFAETTVPLIGKNRSSAAVLPSGGRFVKTHDPYRPWYFSACRKAIYVVRDGRDVAVSYYYYQLRRGDFAGSFSDFLRLSLDGRVDEFGCWHRHVESWLASPLNSSESMLIIRYEDLLRDTFACLSSITAFCELPVDDHLVNAAIEANTAEKMRAREQESKHIAKSAKRKDFTFVRSAKSGGWQDVFSDEDQDTFMAVARPAMQRLGYLSSSGES